MEQMNRRMNHAVVVTLSHVMLRVDGCITWERMRSGAGDQAAYPGSPGGMGVQTWVSLLRVPP